MSSSRPWRHWYKLKEWYRLREYALARDNWLCALCNRGLHRGKDGPRAAIVDHIQPVKGDWDRFIDESNVQSLCKECHDGPKQRQERTGVLVGGDVHGFPADPNHHWHK